jgi:hypothetical protein
MQDRLWLRQYLVLSLAVVLALAVPSGAASADGTSAPRPTASFLSPSTIPIGGFATWAVDSAAERTIIAWATTAPDGGTAVSALPLLTEGGTVRPLTTTVVSRSGSRAGQPIVAISQNGDRVAALWCQQNSATSQPVLTVALGQWTPSGVSWPITKSVGACSRADSDLRLPVQAALLLSSDGSKFVVSGDGFISTGSTAGDILTAPSMTLKQPPCYSVFVRIPCYEPIYSVALSGDGSTIAVIWNERTPKPFPSEGYNYAVRYTTAQWSSTPLWGADDTIPFTQTFSNEGSTVVEPVRIAMSEDGSVMHVAQFGPALSGETVGRAVITGTRSGSSWAWGPSHLLDTKRGSRFLLDASRDGSVVVAVWTRPGTRGQNPPAFVTATGRFSGGATTWGPSTAVGQAPTTGCPTDMSVDASGGVAVFTCSETTWIGFPSAPTSWSSIDPEDGKKAESEVHVSADGQRLLRFARNSPDELRIQLGQVSSTQPKPASPPRSVKGTLRASNSKLVLSVSWSPPTDTGGEPVLRYEYRLRTGAKWGAWVSTARTAVVTTLPTSQRPNYIEVRAVTSVGGGLSASASIRTLK